MRVFIPFTNLRVETYLAVPQAILVPLKDKEHGYGKYLWDRWQEMKTFINVEQDVVPTQEILQEMWGCEKNFCVTSFKENEGPSLLGCVKFTGEFISQTPGLFDDYPDWRHCDTQIAKSCHDLYHQHGAVGHVK